ncbi:hypothetical protein SBA2_900012 [Acidobacteriia bacterium SbA2]|nr:hypothetical protein SBA2_900012 [Acidobacteriia bacterium SbA2]
MPPFCSNLQLSNPGATHNQRSDAVRVGRGFRSDAGFVLDLYLVHLCNPEENPESQLILNPVCALNGLLEHRQHSCKRKEPLLNAARRGLVCWVPLLSIVRKSIQNPL